MNDEQVLQLVDSLFHEFASSYRSEARQRAVEKLTAYNKQSTSASQIADSMQAACLPEPGLFISPRESWLREWVQQLRTL